jgi:hypothetical protein
MPAALDGGGLFVAVDDYLAGAATVVVVVSAAAGDFAPEPIAMAAQPV